jgi:lysozyme
MKISAAGLDLIKSFEGYHDRLPDGSCRAYLDKLAKPHVWTIGWGCTEGITAGMVWTKEQAEAALLKEIAEHEAHVERLVTVDLNQNQFDALVSFCYNVGPGRPASSGRKAIKGLSTSTLLKKLNKGDGRGAAGEFKLWNKAGGKVWPGLVDRRAREATLFLTPISGKAEPAMPQVVEQSAAKPSASTVAAGGLAAGGATSQVITGPPEAVTQTVTDLTMWQTVVTTGQSLLTWGWDNLALVGGIGVTVVGLTIVNGRRTSE